MLKLIYDLLPIKVMAIAFFKEKKHVLTFKAIELLKVIIICIN